MTETTTSRTYYSPIIGGGVTAGVLASNLYKGAPTRAALAKAGIYGLMTTGLAYPIEYRLRRARSSAPIIVKEASSMHNNFFNKTDLDEFVKIAANRMGNIAYQVPTNMAYDAMHLYEALPEKTAATIVSKLYDSVEPGMNKVAMEMVAANILEREKTAAVTQAVRATYKGIKSFAGKHGGKAMTAGEVGLTGYGVKATADQYQSQDRSPYQVGKSYRG